MLSTTINRFELSFERETSNNSQKKMQSDFVARRCSITRCTTMLDHTLQK